MKLDKCDLEYLKVGYWKLAEDEQILVFVLIS